MWAPRAFPGVTASYGGITSGDPQYADRFGWPVDALAGSLVLDWADGDGVNPDTGPTLTKTGTVTDATETPWTKPDGNTLKASTFAANALYADSAALDPTAGHDIVAAVLLRRDTTVAGNRRFFGTLVGGNGWSLYHLYASDLAVFWCKSASGDKSVTVAIGATEWVLIVGVMDADGNQTVYADAVQGTTLASPGGTVASGVGIGIAGAPSGILAGDQCVARDMAWYGANIADTVDQAWVTTLTNVVRGD
jgi:hypothetical protein